MKKRKKETKTRFAPNAKHENQTKPWFFPPTPSKVISDLFPPTAFYFFI